MRTQTPREQPEALRALIDAKRKRGRLIEAVILARAGAHILAREGARTRPDILSRKAFERYLELMPRDEEVRRALAQLATSVNPAHPRARRWIWGTICFIAFMSAAGAIHLRAQPLSSLSPAAGMTTIEIALPPLAEPPLVSTPAPEMKTAEPIVIRAVGDVVLGSDFPVHRLPGENDKQRILALRDTLAGADIIVGNLEGVLYDKGKSRKDTTRPGMFTFRMPESYAAALREMGFDVLSLANNHALDFGTAGLESTVRALRAHGIQPLGAPGMEAAVLKVRDTTIAFLNYSYLPAFARLDDERRVREDIARAREKADLVMISVHAGEEGVNAEGAPEGDEYFMNEYRGNIRRFAELAIDAGASAVFGHGPHIVRPYEIYKGKPVFFSLGNFVGYRSLSTKGKLASSLIAEVHFDPDGTLRRAGIIPLKLDASGVPAVDYSLATLNMLDGLLDESLAKHPVLELPVEQNVNTIPMLD